MDFDAVNMIWRENERQADIFRETIENIYTNLSTINSEYVDNISNIYSNIQNASKTFNLSENSNVSNFTETFHKDYNNIISNTIFSDKYKGLSGYVDNFVDNKVNNEDFFEVIHKSYDYSQKLKNENDTISNEYQNFSEIIKNVENSNSCENNRYGININMGGITQNISSTNAEDVMDMLVDKLQTALTGCGNKIYN